MPVVKLGADGALAHDGCRLVHVDAPVVDVDDSVGAGDSFDAGFLCGRLSGWTVGRSLALGVVCGSLSTRAAGGVAAQPTARRPRPSWPASSPPATLPRSVAGEREAAGLPALDRILAANRRGDDSGASLRSARQTRSCSTRRPPARRGRGSLLCIESTASQVNQEGGYTGMTPAGFADGVRTAAAAAGVPDDRLVLGGDHLGPYPWRGLPAADGDGRAPPSSATAWPPATRRSISTPA